MEAEMELGSDGKQGRTGSYLCSLLQIKPMLSERQIRHTQAPRRINPFAAVHIMKAFSLSGY